jgi:hypothetical protein
MRALRLVLALLLVCGTARAADPAADQLIAKVLQSQKTSGFRIRARLVRSTPGSDIQEVKQLLIRGRRHGEESQVLYQVLWPTAAMGQALLVDKAPGREIGGLLFEPPDKHARLTPQRLVQPLFGSDLTLEDVAEDFWSWPSQKLAGDETVERHPCKILESRPAAGAAGSYSLVKSWIATDITLPLRVEKYGRDGRLMKRFKAELILKQGPTRWAAGRLVVDLPDGHSRTMLEASKSVRDLDIPADQFTLESIRKPLRPAP